MLFNIHDIYIGRSLDLYGEFAEAELELLLPLVQTGDVVVDAGANIGVHTVALAQRVGPGGRVYAFEPQRVVFQTLCANVALNCLPHADCRMQALGAEPGEIIVPELDYAQENNFGGLGLGAYRTGRPVPVATIDALALDACRLIKIDVEGMERSVLAGAADTIRRCRPVLYVENDRAEHSAALIEQILSLGYKLYWHVTPLFRPDNYFRNPRNVFENIVSANMLGIDGSSELAFDDLRPIESPQDHWSG